MKADLSELLARARAGGYAIGAFNVYNLEGALSVAEAAERMQRPALLQIHPSAFEYGGPGLLALCQAIAQRASVPMAVHLDHADDARVIAAQIDAGIDSVMADGSHLGLEENIAFTREVVVRAHAAGVRVEAELGRLSGTEDDLSVAELDAKLTDPDDAARFVEATGVDALAVCIGNVHGVYRSPPNLDFARLEAVAARVSVPLVLHGASGLPAEMIRRAIQLGVTKFNVNTEVRAAGVAALAQALAAPKRPDLLPLLREMRRAMTEAIAEKLTLFSATTSPASMPV